MARCANIPSSTMCCLLDFELMELQSQRRPHWNGRRPDSADSHPLAVVAQVTPTLLPPLAAEKDLLVANRHVVRSADARWQPSRTYGRIPSLTAASIRSVDLIARVNFALCVVCSKPMALKILDVPFLLLCCDLARSFSCSSRRRCSRSCLHAQCKRELQTWLSVLLHELALTFTPLCF